MRAEAVVRAVAECKVPVGVPAEVEDCGMIEYSGRPVSRAALRPGQQVSRRHCPHVTATQPPPSGCPEPGYGAFVTCGKTVYDS